MWSEAVEHERRREQLQEPEPETLSALAGALLLNRNLTSLSCASSELPHATTAALERAARCNRDGDFGRACKRELEELVEADAAESEAESRTPERHELGTSAARRDEL